MRQIESGLTKVYCTYMKSVKFKVLEIGCKMQITIIFNKKNIYLFKAKLIEFPIGDQLEKMIVPFALYINKFNH